MSLGKRTAKHMCVTNMAGLHVLLVCCVEILTSTLMFSGLLQKDLFKGK